MLTVPLWLTAVMKGRKYKTLASWAAASSSANCWPEAEVSNAAAMVHMQSGSQSATCGRRRQGITALSYEPLTTIRLPGKRTITRNPRNYPNVSILVRILLVCSDSIL